MSSFPPVSIIIPTFGGSQSVLRAVRSALAQNYPNFQVIVVDDNEPNSTARLRTQQILFPFIQDKEIVYIQHPQNLNGAAARNTGVKHSIGKYLSFLDDDDVYYEDKILEQVSYLEQHREFDACYCWRSEHGEIISSELEGDLSKQLLDMSFSPSTSSLMITRQSFIDLNGFDESYRRHQDYEFLLRFYEKYRIGVVKKVLLDFCGNEVNNRLYGQKLYDLKKSFFCAFAENIDKIAMIDPKFRKVVYATHFASACRDYLRYGDFDLFLKTYVTYGYKGGVLFWLTLLKLFFVFIKNRFRKQMRNFQINR